MPKSKETSNHPCHFLSLPSAKRFWCRHCMSVFEDAITRWRHSRSCRYGVVDNFMRRRQLEAKALQNTTKPNPIEARLEQSVSPSEEPIMAEEVQASSSAGDKANQATSNDLFRCFICHNKFSTLEEMRHHVKYPCNNKKIVTDVPNPAVTVYIDEFTDRSRQWEPQPQQEEVVSSEFVPNIISQETVHSSVDVKNTIQESTLTSSHNQQSKLTPTNIYVNEQGETVIEVENLDLNSEGGELSLAHLLTQLSQQGIVFDKNKASQMEARQETTLSDPASGEIYTTGTTFDPQGNVQTVVKEEDEGQPTAEDAANTLAQLSVFRGYRSNPATQTSAHGSSGMQKEYIVEGTNMGYSYVESYTIPSTTSSDQLTLDTTQSHPNINVEYECGYLPSSQSNSVGSTAQITLQPDVLDSAPAQYENIEVIKDHSDVHSMPTMHFQQEIQPQVVTYFTSSSSEGQHTHNSQLNEGTVLIENVVVEDASGSAPPQHYHMNISEGMSLRQGEPHEASLPSEIQTNQNSYIVFNTNENSTQILCNPQVNQHELTVRPTSMPDSILHTEALANNHHQHYVPVEGEVREVDNEMKDSEEFEVQTVTLQEIAENESANTVSFQNHSTLSTDSTNNSHIVVSNSNAHSDHGNKESDHQQVELGILHQASHGLVSSEVVEHQLSEEQNIPSAGSSVPMYVVSSNGDLQIMATAPNVEQSNSQ